MEESPKDYKDVLEKYKGLNFVDRLFNKDAYPTIKNEDGTYSTHRMAYGNVRGVPIAFPTIVWDPQAKALKELDSKSAMDYAVKNNEFIPFQSEQEASDFAENGYKRSFGKGYF